MLLVLPSMLLLQSVTSLSFSSHLCLQSWARRGETAEKNCGKNTEQIQHADGKLPRMSNVGLGSRWNLNILREPLKTAAGAITLLRNQGRTMNGKTQRA